jgi:hypothetical protein
MSFRRPRVLKSKANRPSPSKSTHSSPPPTGLVPVTAAPHQRGPYGASNLYSQPDVLLYGPGGPFTQYIHSAHPSPQRIHSNTDVDGSHGESSGGFDNFLHTTSHTTENNDAHRNRRKQTSGRTGPMSPSHCLSSFVAPF